MKTQHQNPEFEIQKNLQKKSVLVLKRPGGDLKCTIFSGGKLSFILF
jgi:hypothetical protein